MTTYRETRNRRKAGRKPVYPYCGQHRDNSGHEWTPAGVRRHERGCVRCQEQKDVRRSGSQSEYRTRKREALAKFIVELPNDDDQ